MSATQVYDILCIQRRTDSYTKNYLFLGSYSYTKHFIDFALNKLRQIGRYNLEKNYVQLTSIPSA